MAEMTPATIGIDQLLLDPNNFRFHGNAGVPVIASHRFGETSVQSAALKRIEADGLLELRASLVQNGYFEVDRVVVKRWPESPEGEDLYVVIEGNRRVSTLKKLRAEHLAGVEISDALAATFDAVPCVVLDNPDRATELAIMGVRHVGGIKEWGGYQGAAIVAVLKNEENLTTSEVAGRLGLTSQEVNRRYRAFTAVEHMRADEEYGDYVTSDHYALLHEAVAAREVREHFGWDSSKEKFADEDRARELYRLITPSEDSNGKALDPKIQRYTEVRALKGILHNDAAAASLADLEQPLATALGIAAKENERHHWREKVNNARDAVGAIGLDDLDELTDQDVEAIEVLAARLNSLAAQIRAVRDADPPKAT